MSTLSVEDRWSEHFRRISWRGTRTGEKLERRGRYDGERGTSRTVMTTARHVRNSFTWIVSSSGGCHLGK